MRTDEVYWDETILFGSRGHDVRRLQEWLVYHGAKIRIDGDFGMKTRQACLDMGIFRSPDVLLPEELYELSKPLHDVQMDPVIPSDKLPNNYADAVMIIAKQHLAAKPVELGAPNSGPWVRHYMRGKEGIRYPWCAGFVSTILNQASAWLPHLDVHAPLAYTMSCDLLARQAIRANRFRSEQFFNRSAPAVFLVRRSNGDWTHTGFAFEYGYSRFKTIEGNTNDAGSREGDSAMSRERAYAGIDFICL